MRALLRRFRRDTTVTFDEIRGEVCDAACRAGAALDRARTTSLMLR
ncbi:hypothetical protein EDD27_7744 [Nonomuraea polychroma]|uniref:Uncharacterized protein n=1 Tax=Nonomuraea polychroma TaxID=46176 RepID=A0A438MGK0_9ACTN|nr:hypothetical protein [Nonomuraea polychroma]RVX44970.1 hypothetical protein EDD27_7744 [Nonomuraea polychroma]